MLRKLGWRGRSANSRKVGEAHIPAMVNGSAAGETIAEGKGEFGRGQRCVWPTPALPASGHQGGRARSRGIEEGWDLRERRLLQREDFLANFRSVLAIKMPPTQTAGTAAIHRRIQTDRQLRAHYSLLPCIVLHSKTRFAVQLCTQCIVFPIPCTSICTCRRYQGAVQELTPLPQTSAAKSPDETRRDVSHSGCLPLGPSNPQVPNAPVVGKGEGKPTLWSFASPRRPRGVEGRMGVDREGLGGGRKEAMSTRVDATGKDGVWRPNSFWVENN